MLESKEDWKPVLLPVLSPSSPILISYLGSIFSEDDLKKKTNISSSEAAGSLES